MIHELATNSLKYGALSAEQGLLDISGSTAEQDVEILWSEQGCPDAPQKRPPEGYGSKLLQRTVAVTSGSLLLLDRRRGGRDVANAGQ